MEESDKELIDAYLNGSEVAFDKLYVRHKQPLYGYLRSMLSAADADDIFQRCWLKACAALPAYRCEGKFRPWLFRIARNLAVDLLRQRKRRGELGLEELTETPEAPHNETADEELCRKLEEALLLLTPEQRAVFEMRREQISFRLIAAEQECTVGTAIMRMRYAMKKLERMLKEFRN